MRKSNERWAIESPFGLIDSICDDSISDDFQFLGEGIGRRENFDDTSHIVTVGNVRHFYRSYDVTTLELGYYMVESKKVYTNSRYLTRLLRFENGCQMAAITFYDYSLCNFCTIGDRLLVGLNSLAWSNPNYPSNFKCKVVVLSKDLIPLKGKMIGYNDEEYTYVDTIYITSNNKIHVEFLNVGFDSDFQYRHIITYNDKLEKMDESVEKEAVL